MNIYSSPRFGAVYTSPPPPEVASTTFYHGPHEYWVINGPKDTDLNDVLAIRKEVTDLDPSVYGKNGGYNEEQGSEPLRELQRLYKKLAKQALGPYPKT